MSELELILLIFRQICFGSLISGFIIFFLTLFLQGSHIFDHDYDLNHDIDHDLTVESDLTVGVDKDIHVGIDKDINVGVDKDLDFHDQQIDVDTPAPLMLILGTFMITFGGTGTFLLNNSFVNPLLSLLITVVSPFLVTIGVAKLWARIAVEDTYQTALETIRVDDEVKTLTTVDSQGGLVRVETSSIHGPIKLAAKTRYGAIPKDMPAYVVEVKGTILIIDEWPTHDGKEKSIPEGKITWE
ncbi:MAG: NfeD family protein [Candidatus Thorarchaeota archaeon]